MKRSPLGTNVILRYLVEDPATIDSKFKGVYPFFGKLERGDCHAHLAELVLFQTFFVLTSYYEVPPGEAAEKLVRLLAFKGLHLAEKDIAITCLSRLQREKIDLVDAYLLAWCERHGRDEVYSFDDGLRKRGLTLLAVQ